MTTSLLNRVGQLFKRHQRARAQREVQSYLQLLDAVSSGELDDETKILARLIEFDKTPIKLQIDIDRLKNLRRATEELKEAESLLVTAARLEAEFPLFAESSDVFIKEQQRAIKERQTEVDRRREEMYRTRNSAEHKMEVAFRVINATRDLDPIAPLAQEPEPAIRSLTSSNITPKVKVYAPDLVAEAEAYVADDINRKPRQNASREDFIPEPLAEVVVLLRKRRLLAQARQESALLRLQADELQANGGSDPDVTSLRNRARRLESDAERYRFDLAEANLDINEPDVPVVGSAAVGESADQQRIRRFSGDSIAEGSAIADKEAAGTLTIEEFQAARSPETQEVINFLRRRREGLDAKDQAEALRIEIQGKLNNPSESPAAMDELKRRASHYEGIANAVNAELAATNL